MAIFQANFLSQSLCRMVTINAIIPIEPALGGPKREDKPFKTLYLLHGYSGDGSQWITNADARDIARDYNLAIILPSGENSFYVDVQRSGRLYSQYVGRELVDFTRSVFPLSTRREDTYIAGLSMGGFGALYNGLRHSDVYSHVIALSSAIMCDIAGSTTSTDAPVGVSRGYMEELFGVDLDKIRDTDKNLETLAAGVLQGDAPKPDLYIACGYNDSLVYSNRNLSSRLTEIGYPHVYEEGPGTHEWSFWSRFLKRALARLPLDLPTKTRSPYWVEAKADSPNPIDP